MAGIAQIRGGGINPFPQDKWLLKELDTYLTGEFSPMEAGKFYPSALGNTCDRYLYLAYNGFIKERPLDAKLQRIFDNGSYLEARMEEYFANLDILISRELRVKLDYPVISGRVDFILAHDVYTEIALELKSINTRGFNALQKSPKPEHIVQLQIYLNLLPMDHGVILYENKNDQQLKAFELERNDADWKAIKDRCLRIMEMIEVPNICGGNRWCQCKDVKLTGLQ